MSDEPEIGDVNPDLSGFRNMEGGDPKSLLLHLRMLDKHLEQVDRQNRSMQESLNRLNEALTLLRTMMLAMAVVEAATNPLATTQMLGIAGLNLAMGTVGSAVIIAETS
jgi:hypothetical protein